MKHPKLTYVAQGLAAALLLFAAVAKFTGDSGSVEVFRRLGMEPGGRYLIAVIESAAALLLLSPFAAVGAVLAIGVMCGAILAHLTRLGLAVNDDGGMLFGMLILVFLSAGFVLFSRRKEIPFVGATFEE